MRRLSVLFLLGALALSAHAAERLTLEFANGKKRTATLLAMDATGVTVAFADEKQTLAWKLLTPDSAFRARKALTPFDDGAARLTLSEFALSLSLFPAATEELEIALALGGIDEAAFEKRAADIATREVQWLTARIDSELKASKDPAQALSAIKQLKERYPDHPKNAVYAPHVEKLVGKLAAAAAKQQAQKEQQAEDKELKGLRRTLARLAGKKDKALKKAAELHKASEKAIEKRQVSRVKRSLVEPAGAERYYKKARKLLREMARQDKQFRVLDKQKLQTEYESLEAKLIECYLAVARTLMQQRNYKGTIPYLRKLLYYDPIHEEGLEMVETIKKNRISFKASDITNARPRVTGG